MSQFVIIFHIAFSIFIVHWNCKWTKEDVDVHSAQIYEKWSYPDTHDYFDWGKTNEVTVHIQSFGEKRVYQLIGELNYADPLEDLFGIYIQVPTFASLHELTKFMLLKAPNTVVRFSDDAYSQSLEERPTLVLNDQIRAECILLYLRSSLGPINLLDLYMLSLWRW